MSPVKAALLRPCFLLAAILPILSGIRAGAQSNSSVSYTSGTYSETFDGLAQISGTDSLLGNNAFAFGDIAGVTGMEGWYGESVSSSAYLSGSGVSATGGFYDFTTGTGGALGTVATVASGQEEFGVRLVNTSLSTVYSSVDVSFLAEQWHNGASLNAQATVTFGDNTFANPDQALPTSNLFGDGNLNFIATNSGSGINSAINPPTSNLLGDTITLNTPWLPGQSLWLTWTVQGNNSPPGVAIDNLNVVASGATSPYQTWTAATSGTWDNLTANWSGSSATYSDGNFVNFSTVPGSGGTVSIQPAGVSPGEVYVTNNTGTYTFSGGAIGGSGALLKSGSGTLVLSSSNSYSGGTSVTSGTLIVNGGDNRLGAPSGGVILDTGGVLAIQGAALVSARNIVVNPGGGVIDTGGFNSSTSGSLSGPGLFTKMGLGDLTVSSPVGASSQSTGLSVLAGSLTLAGAGTQYVNVPATANDFTGNLNLGAAVTLNIAGASNFAAPALIDGGGTVNILGSNAVIVAGPHDSVTSGALQIDNNIVLNSQSLPGTFNSFFELGGSLSNQLTIDGTVSGSSDVYFGANGAGGNGTIAIKAPAAYTGNTFVNLPTGDTLQLGVTNALPAATDLTFNTASTVDLNGFNQTIGGLNSGSNGPNATISNTESAISTLTVNQAADTSYVSNISGNVNLVKSGAGALELTGQVSYTGTTTVSGGMLLLSAGGKITSTAGVYVTGSGVLAGDMGAVTVASGGQVVVASGGTISPGDSIDGGANPTTPFTIADTGHSPAPGGTFDLQSGGTLFISLQANVTGGSQAPGNDPWPSTDDGGWDAQLVVQGNISLSGSLAGTLLDGFTANPGDLFFILLNQGTNPISGAFAGNPSTVTFSGPGGTQTFQIGYHGNSTADTFTGGNDVVLEVVEGVPEPGVKELAMGAFGLLAYGRLIRRRAFFR